MTRSAHSEKFKMNEEVDNFLNEKVSNFLLTWKGTSITVHNKIGGFSSGRWWTSWLSRKWQENANLLSISNHSCFFTRRFSFATKLRCWCTCLWVCGTYVVYHFNGTELHCAPTSIVHHWPRLCTMVHQGFFLCKGHHSHPCGFTTNVHRWCTKAQTHSMLFR